ncbi:MAG: ZIP family metal transporter [Thermicanus sp.]|nr:ZIP family metal transporter [Thermicanus sp.]
MEVWTVVGYGFFLGWVGMNMGGILAYALGRLDEAFLHLFVFMTVGALYTIVFSQILPESLALGGFGMTIIGFALGALFAFWLESFSHHLPLPAHSGKWETFMKSGFLLAMAIGFHNFPSGVALGSTLTHSPSLAHSLSIALMLHNVPEGIALGIPLVLAEIGAFAFFLISPRRHSDRTGCLRRLSFRACRPRISQSPPRLLHRHDPLCHLRRNLSPPMG